MRIKKIKLKNIRSYIEQEIDFPNGSLLLSGSVGSGKTTILLAIEYALFGLQPGQTGSALLRNSTSQGEVSFQFEIEGKDVIIERRLRRAKSVTNEYSAITIDGKKIECSTTELKSKIISLLGYPLEFIKKNNILYRYTVYTPQEHMKQIISEDPEVRLNVLRHIFGIDKYKTIRDNLAIFLIDLKDQAKLIQGEISSLDADKNLLSSRKGYLVELEEKILKQSNIFKNLKDKRKKVEADMSELEQKIKEKDMLETELEKAKVMLSSKKENFSSSTKEQKEMEKNLSENKLSFNLEELKELVSKIDNLSKDIAKSESEYIEILSKANALRRRQNELSEKKDRVFKIEFCPTCLQDVPMRHKHNILNETEKEISTINKESTLLAYQTNALQKIIAKLKEEKNELDDKKVKFQILKAKLPEIEKAKSKLQEILKLKDSLEKDVSLLSKHIDSLKEGILKYSRFNNMYKSIQEELKKAFNEEKNAEILIAELNKEAELTHREMFTLLNSIELKEKSKSNMLLIIGASDWLSNNFISLINVTERSIMLNLRSEFSKVFKKWFSLLVQDSFDVQLDENFTPIIISSGIEMEYSFLSGGERTAVALAYRLALNQTINLIMTSIKTRDLVILDEPTEGFSDAQIEKMREILRELSIGQIIIVSHEQKMEGFVDRVIKLKKDNYSSVLDV